MADFPLRGKTWAHLPKRWSTNYCLLIVKRARTVCRSTNILITAELICSNVFISLSCWTSIFFFVLLDNLSRLFWWEMLRLENVGCSEVCLISNIINLEGACSQWRKKKNSDWPASSRLKSIQPIPLSVPSTSSISWDRLKASKGVATKHD